MNSASKSTLRATIIKFVATYIMFCLLTVVFAGIWMIFAAARFWQGPGQSKFAQVCWFELNYLAQLFFLPGYAFSADFPKSPTVATWIVGALFWGLLLYVLYRLLHFVESRVSILVHRKKKPDESSLA